MCGGGGGKPAPPFSPPPRAEIPELVLDTEGEAKAGALRRRKKLRQGRSSLVTPGLSRGLSIGGSTSRGSNGGGGSLGIGG